MLSYLTWLKIKDSLNDVGSVLFSLIKWIAFAIITIVRFIIYAISSFGVAIFGIAFPFGIYFCFTVVTELMNGVPLMKTNYFGFFLLFFVVPLMLAIVREITKP